MTRTRFILTIGLLCIGAMNAPAAAQGIAPVEELATVVDIDRVRALYGSAAYEEALAAMPPQTGVARADLEQYRALCLLALGREREAVATVERLVRDNPMYLPQAADISPRMQAIFASARSKLVPDVAKAAYVEARAAYESKNNDAAHVSFKRTIELVDSLPDPAKATLADLRLLAGEFLKLSSPPATPAPAAAAADAPERPVSTNAEAFVGPTVVREQLPAWKPPDSVARRREYLGLLRIAIGPDGKVTSATIVKGSHPAYDLAAVTAAKQWLYNPATRGGQPVASLKEIQIRLVPQ